MGYRFSSEAINQVIDELKNSYEIYAPVRLNEMGRFSDTDTVRYAELNKIEDLVLDQKSHFSPKEILFPIRQTLFYFTEEAFIEPQMDPKGIIIFLRSCDIHAVKRLDQMFLENGVGEDPYYKKLRSKVKFILLECSEGFDHCFCVSMGTNITNEYDISFRLKDGHFYCDVNRDIEGLFEKHGLPVDYEPTYVNENKVKVTLPETCGNQIMEDPLWQEYTSRCIACGACNLVCPTCSCYTMQDIFYEDNPKCGERRRVWASCQVDGFSDMAGGHSYRQNQGERMRYKVLHKVVDHKKRFGIHMCVGCGRCDDACPEYVSFSRCVNKLGELNQEEK